MKCLIGNLGKDPELKFTDKGMAIAKFSLAVSDRVYENGQWKTLDTVWYTVTCFRGLAEHVTEVLRRGDRVIVAGRVKESSYTAMDGTQRSSLEVEAQDVGKSMALFKGFQRGKEPTGMVTMKDAIDAFGGRVVDEVPF
jgi:single-strand DNA-binding protein